MKRLVFRPGRSIAAKSLSLIGSLRPDYSFGGVLVRARGGGSGMLAVFVKDCFGVSRQSDK